MGKNQDQKMAEKRRMVSFKESVVLRAESLMRPTDSISGFFTQLLIDKYGPSDPPVRRIRK